MKSTWSWALVSGVAVLLLVLLLRFTGDRPSSSEAPALVMYCAAGMKAPVDEAVDLFEKEFGTSVQIQYGGSGTLLSNLRVAQRGDLYLAADESYLLIAQTNGLLNEIIPLAALTPVIAVRKGNPKNIQGAHDLLHVDVALANPDAAAIGRTSRELLQDANVWTELEPRVRVFKPTVNDVANDIKLATVDAGILWDAIVAQYPELEAVRVPSFESKQQRISVGVLNTSEQRESARQFARFLADEDNGLRLFKKHGYEPLKKAE